MEASLTDARRYGAVLRRGVCLSLLCVLITSSAANSQESLGNRGTSHTSPSRQPLFGVRAAAWDEARDAAAASIDSTPADAPRVLQVSGERALSEVEPRPVTRQPEDSAAPTGETELERYLKDSGPGQRLGMGWQDGGGDINPGATLQDWAENAGLLLGFGMVSLWLIRQWLGRQTVVSGPATQMRTIESLSLPQRCRVHLVEVHGQRVLVTTDAAGVKNVTVLPDRFAALIDEGAMEAEAAIASSATERRETGLAGNWNSLRESRVA